MNLNESIFGIEAPKFIDAESNEILLDYFVVLKDEKDLGTIIHPSIINRHREWIDKGDHWIFEGLIHLFKYDDPEEKYLELKNYYKQNVILYKRRDGFPFFNAEEEDAYFRIDKLEPIFLNASGFPDVLFISFLSVETAFPVTIKEPELIAGYYAGLLTDNPPGTIHGSSSGNWYDINNLNSSTKRLDGGAYIGWNGKINGINCFRTGFQSPNNNVIKCQGEDILTGETDITIICVVLRESVSSGDSIFFTFKTSGVENQFTMRMNTDGKFKNDMLRFSNSESISNITENNYANNEPHIIVSRFNQTFKTLDLIVNGQEHLTDANPDYISIGLNALTDHPWIGSYDPFTSGTYRFNGLIGDLLFYNGILHKTQINKICNTLKTRFNAVWENI